MEIRDAHYAELLLARAANEAERGRVPDFTALYGHLKAILDANKPREVCIPRMRVTLNRYGGVVGVNLSGEQMAHKARMYRS